MCRGKERRCCPRRTASCLCFHLMRGARRAWLGATPLIVWQRNKFRENPEGCFLLFQSLLHADSLMPTIPAHRKDTPVDECCTKSCRWIKETCLKNALIWQVSSLQGQSEPAGRAMNQKRYHNHFLQREDSPYPPLAEKKYVFEGTVLINSPFRRFFCSVSFASWAPFFSSSLLSLSPADMKWFQAQLARCNCLKWRYEGRSWVRVIWIIWLRHVF